MDSFAESLSLNKKGIIFFNEGYLFGILGNSTLLPEIELKEFFEKNKVEGVELKYKSQNSVNIDKKKKVDVFKFSVFYKFNVNNVSQFFNRVDWVKI
jgi:hypothetical protein